MKHLNKITLIIIFLSIISTSDSWEKDINELNEINFSIPITKQEIKEVRNKNNWVMLKKQSTGKAFRAYGSPIIVAGYDNIDKFNVEEISMKFINDNANMLGVNKENVKFYKYNRVNNKWYIHLKQEIEGLTVTFSNIELRINSKAQVFAYGVEYFDTEIYELSPKLDYKKAVENEIVNDSEIKYFINENKSGKLYAFPVFEKGKYKLVAAYRVEYNLNDKLYSAFVSSIDGKTLFRKKLSHELRTNVKVLTNIKQTNRLDPVVKVPVPHQTLNIWGKEYITDKDGSIEIEIESDDPISVDLEGPWVKFTNEVFDQGAINTTIKAGQDNIIEWNDDNSDIRERMVVYHLNKIRDYYKAFDTTKTAMDFQMTLKFENQGEQANAYSGGEVIGFIGMNDSRANLAESPTVLYHEYGHSINMLLYEELGQEEGMVNDAAHEGIADITAAFMVDDSRVGFGAFTEDSNQIIRNCKNEFKYPDDIEGESHHDGQIIAGAFWDIREYTNLETARNLAHFARYGLPDDEDNGICFSEWLVEVLVADDDDGDLTNGTPHSQEIIKAFDNHNIGFDALMTNSLIHNINSHVVDNNNKFTLNCNINLESQINDDSLELSLIYSNDGFKTQTELEHPLLDLTSGNYAFEIPKNKPFGLIQYYFNLNNVTTGNILEKLRNQSEQSLFSLEFGFNDLYTEIFIEDKWTFNKLENIGADLEIGNPDFIDYTQDGLDIIQVKDLENDNDEICIVTGASKMESIQNMTDGMPQTKLEAISPVIDISNSNYAILKFNLWYYMISFDPSMEFDFYVDLSSDEGDTWVNAYQLNHEEKAIKVWHEEAILVNSFIQNFNNKFRFRIRIEPNENVTEVQGMISCLSEFLVDGIKIISPNTFTSIETEELRKNIKIIDHLDHFEISSTESNNITNVFLYDMNGQKKWENKLSVDSQSNLKIQKNQLSSGLYFIEIHTDTKKYYDKLIVVKNNM